MTSSLSPTAPPRLSMAQVLWCSAGIVTLSMGIRHGFGLWLQPITMERGWDRETFALALAIQNLMWGLAGPFAGGLADRFGAMRVLWLGALLYAAGLVTMALSTSHWAFMGGTGLLLGMAQSGTTYAVVYGVIGRQVDPAKRTWAMGVTAAAGSFGQFLMVPVENGLIGALGWQGALLAMAVIALSILPLALGLKEPVVASAAPSPLAQRTDSAGAPVPPHAATGTPAVSWRAALQEALAEPRYLWLTAGYFVCGFQVVFIGVHLPSELRDHGLSPQVATTALALIGLFNVFGTYAAGLLAQRLPKRHILSAIYGARTLAIGLFVAVPMSPLSVYLFAATIGLLWLSTVPVTNALVAQIFGVKHLGLLSGVVFLSHQVGSFLGVWLGGRLYDLQGNYQMVWWLAMALGIAAALANQPVKEHPVGRPAAAAA